jgi:hypothetical protein
VGRFAGLVHQFEGKGVSMAARDVRGEDVGYRAEVVGDRVAGPHDETKWAPLTTEFWAMVVVIAGILIASAASDSLDAGRAWLYVSIVATGYIVSRGIAKAGVDHLLTGVRGGSTRRPS